MLGPSLCSRKNSEYPPPGYITSNCIEEEFAQGFTIPSVKRKLKCYDEYRYVYIF